MIHVHKYIMNILSLLFNLTVPSNNLPPATTPLSSTPTSLVVLIPAQPLFPTADIA